MDEEHAARAVEEEPARKRKKKGTSDPKTYKRNKAQASKTCGKPYNNYKAVLIPAREIRGLCNCRNNCMLDVTPDDQRSLFDKFYSFGTPTEQDIFLCGLIEKRNINRRRPRETPKAKPKTASFIFWLPIDAVKKRVCKKMFLNTFDLQTGRVRRLQALVLKNKIPKRKNLGNKFRLTPEEILGKIKEHIRSFPTHETHYSNKRYVYLDPTLSIKKMHRLFKLKYHGLEVKYKLYYNMFKQHFDLHFGRPQVDTCITCEEINIKILNAHTSPAIKKAAEVGLQVHKKRADKYYSAIRNTIGLCNETDDTVGICFDYMQNLPLPHIPIQDIFYMRQLWVNLFCIHNLKTRRSVCYMYHEGTAKKGANDVCSMLYDYILNYVPKTVKHLRLFSDGCTGQNKNHTMIRLCAALVDTGLFKNVRQYFPVRGHSYNPCDRDFGTIKRCLKQVDRVYHPMEYVALVVNAVQVSGRIEVKYLCNDDIFLDFKSWWPDHYLRGGVSEETKGRAVRKALKVMFHTSEFKEFKHSSSKPGVVRALKFINGADVNTFKILMSNAVQLPQRRAYRGPNPINFKKIDDIRRLLQYIPEEHKLFYDQIVAWPTTNIDVNNEEDDCCG